MKMKPRVWKRIGAVLLAVLVIAASIQWPSMPTVEAAAKAKSVKLNYSEYTLKKGKSLRLKTTVTPKKASKKIIWKSSKKSVAKVSSKGVIKGLKNGKATITATVKGTKVKATCKITVGTPVTKVTVSQKSVALKAGETLRIKATVAPAKASNKKLTYTSSNSSVATVSSKGVILGFRAGKAVITVQSKDGSKKKAKISVSVTGNVTPVPEPLPTPTPIPDAKVAVQSVSTNISKAQLRVGQQVQVSAAVLPENATDKSVTWSSEAPEIAQVDANGLITAKAPGTTMVKVTTIDGGHTASVEVNVSPISVTAITLSETEKTLAAGRKFTLQATVLPEDASNKNLVWFSSNTSVASVENGVVTAISDGTATITAKTENGAVSASCQVMVVSAEKTVTVSSFAELNTVLMATDAVAVTCNSQETGSFEIPEGSYENMALTINTPNATVTNYGIFRRISIKSISSDTWIEKAKGNLLDISALHSHIITEGADTRLQVNEGAQSIKIENTGSSQSVNRIVINTAARVELSGGNKTEIPVDSKANDIRLETSIPVKLSAEQKILLQVLPGAETSSVFIRDETAAPEIEGLGIILVTNQENGETQYVVAENNGNVNLKDCGRITGKIQNSSGEAMENVQVYFIPYTSSINHSRLEEAITQAVENCYTALTDAKGMYTTPEMPYGNYAMIILEEGMQDYFQTVVLNAEVFNNETVTLSAATSETGSVSGVLYDTFSHSPVPEGIDLYLRPGADNVAGDILAQTQTDSQGSYAFTDLTPGTYTVQVVDQRGAAEPYIRMNYTIVILAGVTVREDMTISRTVGSEQIRFVLTWGAEAEDVPVNLDSHLIGPRADSKNKFHVYFAESSYYNNGILYADLDVGDTDYEGPETTTIYQQVDGVYHFYVHDFTNQQDSTNTRLATSQATVKVYRGLQNIATYHVPVGTGTLWDVCTYDTATNTLTPVNTLSYHPGDWQNIGMDPIDIAKVRLTKILEEFDCVEYGDTLRAEISEKLRKGRDLLENGTDPELIRDYMDELSDYFAILSQSVQIADLTAEEISEYFISRQGDYYDNWAENRLTGWSIITISTKNAVFPDNLEIILRDEDADFTLSDSDKPEFDKLLLVSNSRTKAVEKYYISCEEYIPSLSPTEVYEEGNIINDHYSYMDFDEEGNEVWILNISGENETLEHPKFVFEEEAMIGTYEPISGDGEYCGRLTVHYEDRMLTYLIKYYQHIPELYLSGLSEEGNVILNIARTGYWDEEAEVEYPVYVISGIQETLGHQVSCVFDDGDRVPDSYSIAPDSPAHGEWNYLLTLQYRGTTQTLRILYSRDASASFLPNQGYVVEEDIYHYIIDEVELVERDGKTWARITGTEDEFSNWDQLVLENVDYDTLSYMLDTKEGIRTLTILANGQAVRQYPFYYERSIQSYWLNVEDGDNYITDRNYNKKWNSQTETYENELEIYGENPELKNPVFTLPDAKDALVSYEPVEGSDKGMGLLTISYLTQKKVYWVTYTQKPRDLYLVEIESDGNVLKPKDYRWHYDKEENGYCVYTFQGVQQTLGDEIHCIFDAEPESYTVAEEAGMDGLWTHKITISYMGTTQYLYLCYEQNV